MKLLSALCQIAFEWTWKTSIYATLLIVLVFVLQNILAKWLTPRLRYTLSVLVLIRLLLPITPSSVLSFENLFPSAARIASPVAMPLSNQSAIDMTMVQPSHGSSRWAPAVVKPIRISLAGTLDIVWATGCLGLLLLAGWRLGQWNSLIRKGRRISDPRLLDLLNNSRQAMKVRSPVELVAIAQLSSPAVFGLFRLRLLFPETALRQLNDEELRLIFLHEMAHVRRKDIRLNYLLMAVQFLHWFNPLVWLALHRLRADRELVCDAMVMQKVKPEERLGYGKVLLKLMDGLSAGSAVFSGTVPVISSMEEMKRRLLMIKNHRTAGIAACVTTTLVVLALALGSFTRARGQDQPTAAQKHLVDFTNTTISNLTEQLKSGDYPARVSAVNTLWQMRCPDEKVVKALGNIVAHETNAMMACAAATALKDLGPAAALAVPDLMEDLATRNDADASRGSLLRAVIEALGNIGAPAQNAVPLLRERLNVTGEYSLVNRVFSAKALWQITGETNEALPVLIHALQKDKCYWAAQVLGAMGPAAKAAVPALQAMLQTGNGYLRLHSAIALNKIEPDFQLRPILLESLKDAHPAIRCLAAQNIWATYHDSQTILPTLIELLKPIDRRPIQDLPTPFNGQQYLAIQVLGEIGPPARAAIPRLKELVQENDSWGTSRTAAEALKKIEGNSSDKGVQ